MDWVKVLAIGVVAGLGGAVGVRGAGPADPLEMMKQHEDQQNEQRAAATQNADAVEALRARGPNLRRIVELAPRLRHEQVKESIAKGSDFLLGKLRTMIGPQGPSIDQRPWISFAGDQSVGVVALMVHALIEAGRVTEDPRLHPLSKELSPAVTYLVRARAKNTYSAALQAGVLAQLPARTEYRAALQRVRNDLVDAMRPDGGYGYSLGKGRDDWDNSNTQFAVLGMWGVADARMEVPLRFWQVQDGHWRRLQDASGAWGYRYLVRDFKMDPGAELKPLPSITAAGLASLYVATDQLSLQRPAGGDKALEAGLARVEKDLEDRLEELGGNLYYLYAIERVGVATGRKTLAKQDWYRLGAAALVLSQSEEGAWNYAGELPGTALALLFLTHGGAPVVFNVLEHGEISEWDPQPRAVAKLTRWMGRTLERPLNWQVVSGETKDWSDAPMLVISGQKDPGFSPAEVAKLRAYIEGGGMVFSIGDGAEGPFSKAMERWAGVVTEGKYGSRKLPGDHAFFRNSTKMEHPLDMWGISNGARELWVHSNEDLGASWHAMLYHVSEHWQVPLNMMRYATGEERPRARLDSLAVAASAEKPRRTIVLGLLRYKGNWDPEPGAWPRLGALMALEAGTSLELKAVAAAELDPQRTPLVHVTGTEALALDEKETAAIKAFLQNGGTLIADATGGSEAFGRSFRSLAEKLTGEAVPGMLQAEDPMFSGTLPGTVKIGELQFRKGTPADRRIIQDRPEILAWKVGGRAAVYLSQLDVTSGLLGTETSGIAGYRPAVAQRVARDLVIGVSPH